VSFLLPSLSFQINDKMFINLCRIFADEFKKLTSYITQDDSLQLLLTVAENMKIAADLKLGNFVSEAEKISRVSKVYSICKSFYHREIQTTREFTLINIPEKSTQIGRWKIFLI
jgi:ABC-type multidrug transport system ATPase subunit